MYKKGLSQGGIRRKTGSGLDRGKMKEFEYRGVFDVIKIFCLNRGRRIVFFLVELIYERIYG